MSTPSLRAGIARSDITTDAPDVVVHDPLFATALVFDDGDIRLAIIGMDVVAIGLIGEVGDVFLGKLRTRVESELGIPGSHVLVNASHTHPPGEILCKPDALVDRVFDAVRQAQESLEPVKVGTGVGHEDRFVINRTLRLKNGKQWTIRHANPCPPEEQIAELGPIDPEIGILRVDRLAGRPLAVVFNYACHPLIGVSPWRQVTSNYPGFARQVIEDCLGDGAMALFLQGAGGDVTEVLYKDVNHPRDSRPLGRMLGLSTLEALEGIETGDAQLKVVNEPVQFPRRTDVPTLVAEFEREQADLLASLRGTSLNFRTFLPLYLKYALNPEHPSDYSYRYLQEEATGREELRGLDMDNRDIVAKYLRNIQAMERLAHIQDSIGTLRGHEAFNIQSGETMFAGEVQGIRIGDFVLVTCPAEVLTEVGLNVKNASPHPHTFISAFSNGYAHYGPPAADYGKDGYEVTECFMGPGWQEIFEQKAAEVLAKL